MNFAIIGVGGYIAPRHLKAVNDLGGRLICACDVNDSVGILDRYNREVEFFDNEKNFETYISKMRGTKDQVDWLIVCSPNYLHSAHSILGMRNGMNVICEKPLATSIQELDKIKYAEEQYNKKVHTVLQLRLHEKIQSLKKQVEAENRNDYEFDLTYLTSRGPWYHKSWKGDVEKSGGLACNIGVHFFDMLQWIFGEVEVSKVYLNERDVSAGFLKLEKARVRWLLSINESRLPEEIKSKGQTTYRSIKLDGNEIEFSDGFSELHSLVYQEIIEQGAFTISEALPAIKLIESMRLSQVEKVSVNERHPLV